MSIVFDLINSFPIIIYILYCSWLRIAHKTMADNKRDI